MTDVELSTAIEALIKEDQPVFVDYTKNWSDLMPLVVECGISLTSYPNNNLWDAEYDDFITTNNDRFKCTDKNPQRALAECLLKVLQGASQ